MQKSTWLFILLPYLHWFGSLVHGAAVSNSPQRLNNTVDPESLITIVTKERGAALPAIRVFEACIETIALDLGREHFLGSIPETTWSHISIFLGVSLGDGMPDDVQRAFVIVGIYKMLLQMKMENDFRSGVFRVMYLEVLPACDIFIRPVGSLGFKNESSVASVTLLTPSPSFIDYDTNSSAQVVASASGVSSRPAIRVVQRWPTQRLDRLGMLISLMDMLVTAAKPEKDEAVARHTNAVPSSGVKHTIESLPDAWEPPFFTYEDFFDTTLSITSFIIGPGVSWMPAAFKAIVRRSGLDIGKITMVRAGSSTSWSPLTKGNVSGSTGTATARKKRSMARGLGAAGRS